MKRGDYTQLAKNYVHRPGYSASVVYMIGRYIGLERGSRIADVGAGTGKLTQQLLTLGCEVWAVEPNPMMRAQGQQVIDDRRVRWLEGTGEATGIQTNSVDWVTMASSFHWTDPAKSLPEFRRILKPGGYLTVMWNPRDLQRNQLQATIEQRISEIVPELERVSSGSAKHTENIEKTLVSTGDFTDVVFVESSHEVRMDPERYLGVWRSVNDIQAQAGPERFATIMAMVEEVIEGLAEIVVPYRTRAWTARCAR